MSKPNAFPFFPVDFSKYAESLKSPLFPVDFSKYAESLKNPLSSQPFLEAQRRNIETATVIGQLFYDGLKTLGSRQADAWRQGVEDATSLWQVLLSSPVPLEEKIIRQAEASQNALDTCLKNMREISEAVNHCNDKAVGIVGARFKESFDELRSTVKPGRKEVA